MRLLLTFLLLQPAWSFWRYPAKAGTKISDPNEPVHFYAIGDWGSQPYSSHFLITINGGSMHNVCSLEPDSDRCQYGSDDWYREENAQKAVMQQMRGLAAEKPPKWILNVGDNFYFEGVTSTSHWHWRDSFEYMYIDDVFQVPWLSVVGNHDYGGDCCAHDLFGGGGDTSRVLGVFTGTSSALANFQYDTEPDWQWPAAKTRRWVGPNHNYTKIMDLGPYKVQYFGIDTVPSDVSKVCFRCGGCRNNGNLQEVLQYNCPAGDGQCDCYFRKIWDSQMNWLEAELQKSSRDNTIAWRFLIAHHPWNFWPRGSKGLDRLQGLLNQYHVQVHFAGHVHSMRHDVLQGNVQMVMVGSSGGYQFASGSAPHGDYHGRTIYSSAFLDYGFAHMEMTRDKLKINYINDQGSTVWSTEVYSRPSNTAVIEMTAWSECDNLCATGRRTRNVTCKANPSANADEVDMEYCKDLAKPMTESSCACEKPVIQFCEACSTSALCTSCARGFKANSDKSECVTEEKRMLVDYVVEAPQGEWRHEMDDMLESMLHNVTGKRLGAYTHGVFPAPAGTPLDTAELAVKRRPYVEPFIVRATVPLPQTSPLVEKRIVEELTRHTQQPGYFYGGPHADFPELSAIMNFQVLCPHGEPTRADGSCAGDVAAAGSVTV